MKRSSREESPPALHLRISDPVPESTRCRYEGVNDKDRFSCNLSEVDQKGGLVTAV